MKNIELNFSYLDMLVDGDPETKQDIFENFEKMIETIVPKLNQEFVNKDYENMRKTAHQLKPSAKMVYLPCAELLEKIQLDPATAESKEIDSIKTQFTQALLQLRKWNQSNE